MRADPLTVAAWELIAGDLRTEELPELAIAALIRGIDSPSLGELAAQDRGGDVREWRELFVRVLDELGIELPDPDQARWNLVRETARAIIDGDIAPASGARRIWRWSWDVRDSGDLRIFVGLASELEDHPDDRVRLEGQVTAEAAQLLHRPRPRIWIQLMAVNGGSGLSRSAGSSPVEIDPADLPISQELRSDVAAWAAEHDRVMVGWPRTGGFASALDAERFVDAGRQLVCRLQDELGEVYYVEYMPEAIRPPGVRLRSV